MLEFNNDFPLRTADGASFEHGCYGYDISDVGYEDQYGQNRKRVCIHNGNRFSFRSSKFSMYDTVINISSLDFRVYNRGPDLFDMRRSIIR
jgi:hypothetical protein